MAWINILSAIYPVGSIYISTIGTSPATLIGGTWTQLTDAVLRASNSFGYGGTDDMTLTVSQMPAHTHSFKMGGSKYSINDGTYPIVAESGNQYYALAAKQYAYNWHTTNNQTVGGGESFSKLPRYINLYAWRRTA